MPGSSVQDLLARITGQSAESGDSAAAAATMSPEQASGRPATSPQAERERQEKLEQLLGRIAKLTTTNSEEAVAEARPGKADSQEDFYPPEPTSLAGAKISESEVEALILKFLLARGDASGREVGEQVKLPFVFIEALLRQMKQDQLVVHRGSAPMNDYQFELADLGRERARRHTEHCTYFGAAPVHLSDYVASVNAQSLVKQHPTVEDLRRAFDDLLVSPRMLARLGPAINSGRGLFLYGSAGNGKTSIAERVTRAFGRPIWIPRAIGIDGEIIRVYDPSNHEEVPLEKNEGLLDHRKIDRRWVRIRRPTILAGGELTMASLEVTLNTGSGINEAPLQMKSNCGTLVIDDFGRQRIQTHELLNRWIVPLEKRVDYLNLASGKKIQVPFDQLIIFSTNLEPRELVDEAFLRRIPYKIEICDPTEEEFRELFKMMCPRLGFEYREDPISYVIEKHYHAAKRQFRCCQPRDLLLQVRNFCLFHNQPLELSHEYFDFAVENYFAIM